MFTLPGLFLEDGENLFRDFWSPFSISFLSFSACPIKKTNRPTGPCPARTLARPAFISREVEPRKLGPDFATVKFDLGPDFCYCKI